MDVELKFLKAFLAMLLSGTFSGQTADADLCSAASQASLMPPGGAREGRHQSYQYGEMKEKCGAGGLSHP